VKPISSNPRTNWSDSSSHRHMNEAIKEWMALDATPSTKDKLSRGKMSRGKFANSHNIPATTFRRRLESPDPFQSPMIGPPCLVKQTSRRAIVDAAARYDEVNNGKTPDWIIGSAAGHLNLTHAQMKNQWHRHLKHDPTLTPGLVSVDPSSASRTAAISETNQRMWMLKVREARKLLIKQSTGVYTIPGGKTVTYEEVQEHFVMGSDEVIITKHRCYHHLHCHLH